MDQDFHAVRPVQPVPHLQSFLVLQGLRASQVHQLVPEVRESQESQDHLKVQDFLLVLQDLFDHLDLVIQMDLVDQHLHVALLIQEYLDYQDFLLVPGFLCHQVGPGVLDFLLVQVILMDLSPHLAQVDQHHHVDPEVQYLLLDLAIHCCPVLLVVQCRPSVLIGHVDLVILVGPKAQKDLDFQANPEFLEDPDHPLDQPVQDFLQRRSVLVNPEGLLVQMVLLNLDHLLTLVILAVQQFQVLLWFLGLLLHQGHLSDQQDPVRLANLAFQQLQDHRSIQDYQRFLRCPYLQPDLDLPAVLQVQERLEHPEAL